jgi:hypothetical protein
MSEEEENNEHHRRVERRTAITEAEKRPAKTYMRFSEGRA